MTVKWANNAVSAIADVTLAADATTLNLTPGTGALFPALAAGDSFNATLISAGGDREIIKCTARSTDALTIERAQEGTTGIAFAQDDIVSLRVTAGQLDLFIQAPVSATENSFPVFGSSTNELTEGEFIQLPEMVAKPTLAADSHGIYAKADGVYIEMSDGTEIQILDFTTERSGVDADIPSGETILFEKDTVVTGYTLLTSLDDVLVYIGKGTGASGLQGGTSRSGGTWTQPNHTLVEAEIPSHYFFVARDAGDTTSLGANTMARIKSDGENLDYNLRGNPNSANVGKTNSYGGSGAHSHGTTYRPPGRIYTRQTRQ